MRQRISLIIVICLLAVAACQKGIHWDLASEGSLVKDSSGNCMPVNTEGNFVTNKLINDSNFLTVNVLVTTAGTYSISSDSINGYIFKASGTFNNTGVVPVKLVGSGKPLISGTNQFTITYNNSQCEAFVTVISDSVPAAQYTLQGSPNSCMNDTVKGSYLQAVALDTSNKVIISVSVVTPGSYSISTNTVNGYSFSGVGIFTTAGIQSVAITGSGAPLTPGNDVFMLTANNSTCNFSITVTSVVQVNNTSHFPLTTGSYWTYIDPTFGDTTRRYVNGDSLINDTNFIRVSEPKTYSFQNYFFNFDGSNYTEFGKVDKYTNSFQYYPLVYGLLPFLKENLTTGVSWESGEFKGTASFGQAIYLKYDYYCLNSNLSIVVNGFGFKDVYLISVYPQIKSDFGPYGSTSEVYYYYYAKGVGLIYEEESINGYPPHPVLQIVDWKVN